MVNARHIGVIAAVTALSGLIGGGVGYATNDVPPIESFQMQTTSITDVEIWDPDDVLTSEDEARMLRDAQRIQAPETVTKLRYLVFATNREKVNDSVEEYLRDNHPDLIGEKKFADGLLLVGVGLQPRQAFVFAGPDVAAELDLKDGSDHLRASTDAMKEGVKAGNIPAGLFKSARTATDVETVSQLRHDAAAEERSDATSAGGIGAGLAGLGASTGAVALSERRRRKIDQARDDYDRITGEYTRLAGRLDELDIRANSIASSFADHELRDQWNDVRNRFFKLHEFVNGAGGIGEIDVNDDKSFLAKAKQLATARETVDQAFYAEENIDRLFEIERGDPGARRADLTKLIEDVSSARHQVRDRQLRGDLTHLEGRIRQLDANPSSPTFLDDFVRILYDYRTIMAEVKRREFSDVKEYEALHQPRLYDHGFFYGGVITYSQMDSWHATNVSIHEERTSSSSDSSGSSFDSSFSSGFSGDGGSSSF
ncbi:DUF5129 domain-containing protein [Corynebacterium aquatimens]|uniref:DUF5129 domain-containing protein n=1 Tax=Corynebacterium aquatimens TaxID=1190508 RepID=A0A931GT80_9CORY|nr:DUF5129 domain-containing protein [Corynebacterium aquatimens]MBG6122742.1 hypothetical protein [Corynebacterium aquatimens]WJY66921.1 hypothetical protein CAQUA_11190 [Corynebacterium aquatimens]